MISEDILYPRKIIMHLSQLFKVIWWVSTYLDLDYFVGLLDVFVPLYC